MTRFWNALAMGALFFSAIALQPAYAEDVQIALPEPSMLSSTNGILSGHLVAREAVADIGNFGQVKNALLYGFSRDGTDPTPKLIPDIWQLQGGDSIDYVFENKLPCNNHWPEGTHGAVMSQSNIHTHGFMVSPHDIKDGKYGDHIYVLANSSVSEGGGHDGCMTHEAMHHGTMTMGSINYKIDIPQNHPPGIYWYHPHAHGISGQQIAHGLSGLITVGKVWDYAWINCQFGVANLQDTCLTAEEKQAEQEARNQTEQHFVLLKDMQVERDRSGDWQVARWFEPEYCQDHDDTYTQLRGASCSPQKDPDHKWLFTVNGALDPKLSGGPGKSQILRMANIGGTVSYNLELKAFGKAIPYQVLHNDGVNASVEANARNPSSDHLLMMPSSRAEIYLDRGEICKAIGADCNGSDVDVSMNIVEWTCPDGKSNSCGDLWPTGKIMDIVLPALSPSEVARPLKNIALASDAVGTVADSSTTTVASNMKCSDGTPVAQQLQKGEFRVIALWNGEMHDKEMFAMSTDAVAHRTVPDFTTPEHMNPDWLKSKGFKPFDHHHTDLCISAEQHESWLIYNASDEFHNFHVHQTDFQVTEVSGNEPAAPGIPVGVVADNYPVPPHHWIKVDLRFSNNQAGRFVYHCHILEHEDKGMMSTIEVVAKNMVSTN